MSKKSCTYCDSTSHQTGSCPHLPHGDAHRAEKPVRKKAVVCGIGITYNPNSPKNRFAEVRALCAELPALEERLHRAGLHKSAHALNKATKIIGFEAAEMLSAKPK